MSYSKPSGIVYVRNKIKFMVLITKNIPTPLKIIIYHSKTKSNHYHDEKQETVTFHIKTSLGSNIIIVMVKYILYIPKYHSMTHVIMTVLYII